MSGRNVIFAKQKIDGFASNANYGGLYTRGYNFPESGFEDTFKYSFTLEAGETYIVVWDGEEFPVIGQDASAMVPGAVALGNCSAFDLDGNNEPFALATIAGSGVTFMSITETVDSHTVVIYQAGGDSLLPDTPVDFAYNSSFGVFAHSEFAPTFGIEAGQKYTIVWDNKKYARTAFAYIYADGSECVGLGNPLAAGQEGNNDPFCVVYDVTHNYLHYMSLEQDTSHTVAVCQLAEGFDDGSIVLPEMQYDGFTYASESNFYALAIAADSEYPLFDLVADKTYTVYWDGEPYVCVAEAVQTDDAEVVFVGNVSALGLQGGNEAAPFIIVSTADGNELADLDDAKSSHSVSIYYGATTGNGDTTALPETALSGFEQDNTGFYGVYFSPAIYKLEAGTEYMVVWDGVEYKVTAIDIGDIMDGFVFAGNGADFIAPDSGEPFAITSYSDSEYSETTFYALRDYDKEHTIAIYYADEGQVPDEPVDPDEEPETREGIILKDRNGKDVAYYGIETVTFDTTTEGKQQVYSKGVAVDNFEVALDFSDGDMNVIAPENAMMKSATIKQPDTLIPEHIKKGIEVAGVEGNFAGDIVDKTIDLDFRDLSNAIYSEEDMDNILNDRNNLGKQYRYLGESGKYINGMTYKVADEYEAFDPNACGATAAEVASDTTLTASVECNIGDLVIAAFVARSALVSLSDGWTLISTSQSVNEINATTTYYHTLSFAYKYATSDSENITIVQEAAGRMYINLASFAGATGFEEHDYQYVDGSAVSDMTYAVFNRPDKPLILWGATRYLWSTSNYPVWELSNNSKTVQLGNSTQSRLLLAIDSSTDNAVTFNTNVTTTADAYLCGALSIQLAAACNFKEVGMQPFGTAGSVVIEADEDTVMSKVTIVKPVSLVPENILKNVEIAGVVGTYELNMDSEISPYVVYQIDTERNELVILHILFDKLYADTGSYDIVIPDKIGSFAVAIDSKGV